MNKKGFIAISIIFSFFIVFLMLLTINITNYAQNRILMGQIKKDIKKNVNMTIGADNSATANDLTCWIEQNGTTLTIYPANSDYDIEQGTLKYKYRWTDGGDFDKENTRTGISTSQKYTAFIQDTSNSKVAFCSWPLNN